MKDKDLQNQVFVISFFFQTNRIDISFSSVGTRTHILLSM